MKNILILGKDSYIGEHVYNWLRQYPDSYNVEIVSTLDYAWKKAVFSKFDVVINFAGIAHINNITEEMKPLFYSVNRDLAIEIADYAKQSGVKHFIHLSSMNVYGDFCDSITDVDNVNPTGFYGDSKLQGELGVRELASKDFNVAILRPPFVYGKGCRGNYNTVRKIACKVLLFPTYRNKKSMIYIDNLCELIRLIIDNNSVGIFTPQNKELVSTADLVREIAKTNNHRVCFTSIFNLMIPIASRISKLVRKAFINDNYALEMSKCFDWKYCIVDFAESVKNVEVNHD